MNWSIKNMLFSVKIAGFCVSLVSAPCVLQAQEKLTNNISQTQTSITPPTTSVKKTVKKGLQLPQFSSEELVTIAKKNTRDMNIHDLRAVIPYAEQEKMHPLQKEATKKLLQLTTDPSELCTLRFDLAELHFNEEEFKEAKRLFQEYIRYYPTGEKYDTAEYKMIVAQFKRRNKPARDMTKTKKAITYANHYLNSPRKERAYTQEIINIKESCFKDLFAYDETVINHYVIQKQWTGARTRLENSKKDILTHAPSLKPQFLELEGKIAFLEGKIEESKELLAAIKKDFPTYKPDALLAYLETKQKSFFAWL